MEYRKLIKFGNSSHIISLPNRWVKKNKLKKGDLIYFEENGNGEIILNHEIKKEDYNPKEITINILNKPLPTIERELMHAYINDYDTINIIGDLKRCRKEIEGLLQNLLVLEIMEQTPNKIIAKDFLNLNEVSIPENIRKIDLNIKSMMIDLKETLEKRIDNFNNISYLDTNINKFRFLLYRAINKHLKNNTLPSNPKLNSFIELLNYRLIINNLEDTADECKRISRFLVNAKIKKNEMNSLKKIFLVIENNYLDVMKAYNTSNKQLAHEVASRKDAVIEQCRILFKSCGNKNVGVILERLKAMKSFIRNIARIIIDSEKVNGNNK